MELLGRLRVFGIFCNLNLSLEGFLILSDFLGRYWNFNFLGIFWDRGMCLEMLEISIDIGASALFFQGLRSKQARPLGWDYRVLGSGTFIFGKF